MGNLGIGIGIGVGLNRSNFSWSSYWTPQTAVVENAVPTDVVLTYAKAVNPADAIAGNFTIAGKTISGAVLDGTGKILTLTVTVAFVYGDSITVVANGTNIAVTNNISAEAELTTYITGLITPLSTATLKKINDYLKLIKTDLGATDLEDAEDVDIILAGETAESSLKNIAKNDHHATAVNAPTFTSFEGFTGDGISSHISVDYTPSVDGNTFLLNSAHFGLYVRVFVRGSTEYHGVYSTAADGGTSNSVAFGDNFAGNLTVAINDAQSAESDSATSMYMVLSRINNTGFALYRNKAKTDFMKASTKRPNQALVVLARRTTNATVGLFSRSQVSHITLGKGLSETEVGKQTDDFEAYMDANGKGVIA